MASEAARPEKPVPTEARPGPSAAAPGGRLTPLDIQRAQFNRRTLGGLDEDDVYRFLTRVARDLEEQTVENRRLKEQVLRHQKQLQDYMDLERTLKQTLQSAQRSSGETRIHAEKEAALVLKQAELDAERIVEEARAEARQLMDEVRELRRARRQLRIELKNVLDSYADLLKEENPRPARPTPAAPPPPPVAASAKPAGV